METVILLFLLASLDKDSSITNSLRNFLGFYRENRELISMLAGAAQGGRAQGAENGTQKPEKAEKESRPEQAGSPDLLDEYLKRCAV